MLHKSMPFLLLAYTTLSTPALAVDPPSVPYPTDYRGWRHIKTMLIQPGHALYESFGGLHHIYANAAAVEGYQRGQFPDGAVIVFDLLSIQDSDHSITTGQRKVLGVMQKDAKAYATTGGWGFEAYAAGDAAQPVVGNTAASACFACHTQRKQQDYVFSQPQE